VNLKFWQKKPAAPVAVMSGLEQAILNDLIDRPEAWSVREWKDGAVRADSGGVAIVSSCAYLLDTIASCGALKFGSAFANEWHKIVSAELTKHRDAARDLEIARVKADLEARFA